MHVHDVCLSKLICTCKAVIPVVFPRLSQLLIQCCQLSLLLLRARLRLEVLPPPGVASRFFNGRRSLVAVAPAPQKFIAAAIEGDRLGVEADDVGLLRRHRGVDLR